jgi:hypothetical protein
MLSSINSLAYLQKRQMISGPPILIGSTKLNGSATSSCLFNTSFAINLSQEFTIEAWVYISDNATANQSIIGLGNNTTYANIYYLYNGNSGFSFVTNTGSILGSQTVYENSWAHVAVTRDISGTELFINGFSAGSVANNITNFSTTGIAFGRKNSSTSSNYFNGNLAGVRISNVAFYTSSFTLTTGVFSYNDRDIGVWHFNTDTNWNISRNGSVLTINNASWSDIGPATIGKVTFNGTNFLSGTLIDTPAFPYTIEFFFRINNNNNSSSNNPMVIFSNQRRDFIVKIDPSFNLKGSLGTVYSDDSKFPGDASWRHCSINRNSSAQIIIRIDGEIQFNFTETSTNNRHMSAENNTFRLGSDYSTPNICLPNGAEIAKFRYSTNSRYGFTATIPNIRVPYFIDGTTLLAAEFIFNATTTSSGITTNSPALTITGSNPWGTE